MCQGLPCVGKKVRLLHSISVRGVQIPADSIGTVRKEFLPQRELLVYFDAFKVEARLSEGDLGEGEPLSTGEGA